jgi:hypothetical protein
VYLYKKINKFELRNIKILTTRNFANERDVEKEIHMMEFLVSMTRGVVLRSSNSYGGIGEVLPSEYGEPWW